MIEAVGTPNMEVTVDHGGQVRQRYSGGWQPPTSEHGPPPTGGSGVMVPEAVREYEPEGYPMGALSPGEVNDFILFALTYGAPTGVLLNVTGEQNETLDVTITLTRRAAFAVDIPKTPLTWGMDSE